MMLGLWFNFFKKTVHIPITNPYIPKIIHFTPFSPATGKTDLTVEV